MRKIAIITVEDSGCYECDYSSIITSITDWSEVSDEDYDYLKKASVKSGHYNSKIPRFMIIERPTNEHIFIRKTIDDYKKMVLEEERKAEEEKRKRAEAAARRKEEAAAKKIEKLKKQLEKLEAEENNLTKVS